MKYSNIIKWGFIIFRRSLSVDYELISYVYLIGVSLYDESTD